MHTSAENRTAHIVCLVAIAAMLAVTAGYARAGVESFSLRADTRVDYSVGGSLLDQATQTQSYPDPSSAYPVQASGAVRSVNDSSLLQAAGFGEVLVNDPQYNEAVPADFMLSAVAGTYVADSIVDVTTTGTQDRSIRVLSDEVNGAAEGSTVNLQSTFQLDAMLLGVPGSGSADGTSTTLSLNIMQDSTSLFSGSITLTGTASGTFDYQVSGGFSNITFLPLQIPLGADLGTVHVVQIADLEIPFEYSAVVGESFDLTAKLATQVTAVEGTAAGTFVGTLPTELIETADELFSDVQSPAGVMIASPAPEPASVLLLMAGWLVGMTRQRRS